MRTRFYLLIGILFISCLINCACADDDSADDGDDDTETSSSDADNDTDTDTDTDGDQDTDTTNDDPRPNGSFCCLFEQCESGFCAAWRSAPYDADAVCADGPPLGQTRIQATVVDLATRIAVADASVGITGAMAAAVLGPTAEMYVELVAGADGRYDVVIPEADLVDQLGIVAIAHKEGYYATSTGLAEPLSNKIYSRGTDEHETLLVPLSLLDKWSALLEAEPDLAPYGPLGDRGGVIGSIITRSDGKGVAESLVKSSKADSTTIVLYPNADNSAFQNVTSSSGIFIIIDPDLAEEFAAYDLMGKALTDVWPVGSTVDIIFSLSMTVEDVQLD